MDSIWIENSTPPRFEALTGNKNTDVLIVGGGMAGLLCAYMLKNAGVDCLLVEADRIANGITRNTTAKITLAHGLIYSKLIRTFGKEKAALYLAAQKQALRTYEKLCQNIACDYEKKDSFVYSIDDRAKIEDEIKALYQLGNKAEFSPASELPFPVAGAVRVKNEAQFHPLKFAYKMAEALPIYENTKVVNIEPHKVSVSHGEIRFKKMILATHFPTINKHGLYFLKMYQHRSYVIALDGAQNVNGMYVDENKMGLSFRNYGDVLLLGGGSHRTGKRGGNWRELEAFAREHYPKAKIQAKWATQDCMTLDDVPYIGLYSKNTPDLYVATGFNKWGMTSSMVAATLLSDLICGKENEYREVFDPSRNFLRPQLAVNAVESLIGLLTPTAPRCPHLGCALKYNRDEHSWDCPCHGSRFTETGQLINNPATDDKKHIPSLKQ